MTTKAPIALSALLVACFLTSCGYYKEKEIRQNAVTGESQYVIWIWHNMELIDDYRIPLEDATCEKVDSLNSKADSLLARIKKLENCR